MVYVIPVCGQLAGRNRMELSSIRMELSSTLILPASSVPSWWNWVPSCSCLQAVRKPVWRIPLPCAQWNTPDDGQRNCPKHVEFHSKVKFRKLVHLVSFIVPINSTVTILVTTKRLNSYVLNKCFGRHVYLLSLKLTACYFKNKNP